MNQFGFLRRSRMYPQFECLADAEADRVRRVRRANFRFYLIVWLGFFVYAVWRFLSASTIETAIDRFLPLQLVAGLAALAVFLCGRSLGRRTVMRKFRFVPVAFTTLGIGITALTVLATNPPSNFPNDPGRSSELQSDKGTMLVSL